MHANLPEGYEVTLDDGGKGTETQVTRRGGVYFDGVNCDGRLIELTIYDRDLRKTRRCTHRLNCNKSKHTLIEEINDW